MPPLPDPEKLAVLLYTAGTSGRPRAAMLTHRAMLANLEQVARVEPPMIRADDVVLAVLPLFHVYGLNAVLGGAVRHGATVVLQERFDAQGTLDLVAARGCTMVPLAPAVFRPWLALPDLRSRLSTVRLVLSGSAPLPRDVVEEFEERTGIPVHQGYGLTEAAPVVTSTLCSAAHHPGSVGAALDGVGVRLVDERGVPVVGDDPGEIEIRGANLFSGYWPDGAEGPDDEGWWATGDVGFLDETGDLFLVDRLKELVVVSGFNVYPHEVEDVIRRDRGDHRGGRHRRRRRGHGRGRGRLRGRARPRPGRGGARPCARPARSGWRGFKQPSRIEVVDALPMSVTGKVQKGRLRGLERRRALELLE